MTLVARIIGEKRALVVPLALALAANVAFAVVAVYPLRARVATAERRATTAAQNLRAARERLEAAQEAQAGKAQADEQLRRFYDEVLPRNLAGARAITYARLARMAEQVNLRYERRSTTPERERGNPLARLHTTLVLAGSTATSGRFIYQLETSPEFVVIEEVLLEQGPADTSDLVLTLVSRRITGLATMTPETWPAGSRFVVLIGLLAVAGCQAPASSPGRPGQPDPAACDHPSARGQAGRGRPCPPRTGRDRPESVSIRLEASRHATRTRPRGPGYRVAGRRACARYGPVGPHPTEVHRYRRGA